MNRLLISHRGNLRGAIPHLENTPAYIQAAIDLGYMCEVDMWHENGNFYLGHDEATTRFDMQWLESQRQSIIIHCKNMAALMELSKTQLHYFWHGDDDCTITSKCWTWCYPGTTIDKAVDVRSPTTVCVLPERHDQDTTNFSGICSDLIEKYDKASSL